jgi:dUTP pyrophosphatase
MSKQAKIKLLREGAVVPKKSRLEDEGHDCFASTIEESDTQIKIGLGFAVEPPPGYYTVLVPRSSITKKQLVQGNSVGIVDKSYRGEVTIILKKLPGATWGLVEPNEKIAQILFLPESNISVIPVGELSDSDRGEAGFGSSGKF